MISPHLLSPHSPVTLQGLATLNLCRFPERPKTLSGLRVCSPGQVLRHPGLSGIWCCWGQGRDWLGTSSHGLWWGWGPTILPGVGGLGGDDPATHTIPTLWNTLLSLLPAWLPIWVWMTPPPGSLPSFPPPHRVRKPPSLPRSQGPLFLSSRNTQDAEF